MLQAPVGNNESKWSKEIDYFIAYLISQCVRNKCELIRIRSWNHDWLNVLRVLRIERVNVACHWNDYIDKQKMLKRALEKNTLFELRHNLNSQIPFNIFYSILSLRWNLWKGEIEVQLRFKLNHLIINRHHYYSMEYRLPSIRKNIMNNATKG